MDQPRTTSQPTAILVIAWTFLLLASNLPRIILQELFEFQVSANLGFGLAVLVIIMGLALTFLWGAVQALRPYFILFLVLVTADWLVFTQIGALPMFANWLANPSFNVSMLANQSLRLMVTLTVIAVLFILKKRREAFFLVKGDISAPLEPVTWLGIKQGETWSKAGRNFAVIISLGTLTFLVLAGRPSLDIVARAPCLSCPSF